MAETLSLNEIKRRVRARMSELRPFVDEYEELEAVANGLAAEEGTARAAAKPSGGGSRARGPRAPRGASRAKVYAVIEERPGVSVAELAAVSGVAKPVVYGVTRKGVAEGELERVDLGAGQLGFRRRSE
jgi:hypothetical protein